MTTEHEDQAARAPPPLPPRTPSSSLLNPLDPEVDGRQSFSSHGFDSQDPRSSSQQSLVPENTGHDERRKLLLIYIHGFMGAETSFLSFPAHVHNLLTITLAESHIVHSKIYPRYKTRQKIHFVADEFSKW